MLLAVALFGLFVEIQQKEKIGYEFNSNVLLILILYYSSIKICNGAENNTLPRVILLNCMSLYNLTS